jgi:hypothetical protein
MNNKREDFAETRDMPEHDKAREWHYKMPYFPLEL